MTKSQVDRLGARLRADEISDADLRALDEYRRSFAGAYNEVMRRLRDDFGLAPTGRAAKSTFAIVGKLRRESVRLSQIQDVAGCRVIVPDVPAQDAIVEQLAAAFDSATVLDRRRHPSHGYQAVHLVIAMNGKVVEVQVRTAIQQLWAEMSEKLSDKFGIEVKYGQGREDVRKLLDAASGLVTQIGAFETDRARVSPYSHDLLPPAALTRSYARLAESDARLAEAVEAARSEMRRILESVDQLE